LSDPGEPVVVREHEDSTPVRLTVAQRDALARLAPTIALKAVPGSADVYTLNPGNLVGAIQVDDLRFELRPKLPIRRLLFILSYSLDPRHWREEDFAFEEEPDLFEAIVHGFASQLERELRLGPLQGYRYEEDSLQTIRGRIRFDDHIRSHFGLIPPIECAFDEFTEDIEINRLLRAAIVRLREIRLRERATRLRLRALLTHFAAVTPVTYDPRGVPEIRYDRRTERYRGPVELARLILSSRSFDSRAGAVAGAAFLLNLAGVFENFIVVGMRESLGVGEKTLVQHAKGKGLHLDSGRTLKLEPDISWWEGGECLFVGDVKYKRTRPVSGVQHPDVYQLLAYTTATRRRRGLLIYAASTELDGGEAVSSGAHVIAEAGKTIEVRALDLDVPPADVLGQIEEVAADVRRQVAAASQPSATSPLPAAST
jgi:5-methylcytosine-specific restriction enzyme subunit McrC